MTGNNIWDLAIEHALTNEKSKSSSHDSIMLVVGSKNSGKTSLCYKFVDKTDAPKPTLALEYSFARRSRTADLEKDVCHIWELGGGTVFKDLLTIPITAKTLIGLSVVLVLDLSLPEELWFTTQGLLDAIRKQIQMELDKCTEPTLKEILDEKLKMRFQNEAEFENTFNPFPVPLLIIGSKYDLFQEIESEKRKLICKCLRYFAHINGATLQFVSNRNENLMNKLRVSLSHLIFGTAVSKSHVLDYNKPLYVPFGIDSFDTIGPLPDPDNTAVSLKVQSLTNVANCFVAFFPQIEDQNVIPDDPGDDPNFKEHDIDNLRVKKDKESEEFRKQFKQQKQNMWR